MVERLPPMPWPAAALLALFAVACASTAPVDPAGFPTPAASSVAEAALAPPPPPTRTPPPAPGPAPSPRRFDCDPGGPPPMLCVAASETEGEAATSLPPGRAGKCRSRPKVDICRGCRPDFVKFEKGACCYQGLSRFPLCKDLPPDER